MKKRAPRWPRINSVEQLEAFYKRILPKLRKAARKCGYALGLHGSMRRDLDLIAAPWREVHADRDTLARAIMGAATGGIVSSSFDWKRPDTKPCGRVATSLPVCWTGGKMGYKTKGLGHIDLSVMPDTTLLLNLLRDAREHVRDASEDSSLDSDDAVLVRILLAEIDAAIAEHKA